jgi:hypothetical protein
MCKPYCSVLKQGIGAGGALGPSGQQLHKPKVGNAALKLKVSRVKQEHWRKPLHGTVLGRLQHQQARHLYS